MAQSIEVARRGQITIPKSVRDSYGIAEGQKYRLRMAEGGVIVLTPRAGKAAAAVAELRSSLVRQDASLEQLLAELRSMREADGT